MTQEIRISRPHTTAALSWVDHILVDGCVDTWWCSDHFSHIRLGFNHYVRPTLKTHHPYSLFVQNYPKKHMTTRVPEFSCKYPPKNIPIDPHWSGSHAPFTAKPCPKPNGGVHFPSVERQCQGSARPRNNTTIRPNETASAKSLERHQGVR